jgi:predicted amidohydrolase YtcJ
MCGACVLLALLSGCEQQPAQEPADLVILGGDIQTMDAAAAHASAVAVRDGKLVYVGDDAGVKPHIGRDTQVVEAQGATVLPGLIDSHIHAAEGALGLGGCSLEDKQLTVEAAGKVIRDCLTQEPSSGWLVVSEVNSAGFRANRKGLDAIVADRPLFLWGADGHTGWVNSKGLALAGIARDEGSAGRSHRANRVGRADGISGRRRARPRAGDARQTDARKAAAGLARDPSATARRGHHELSRGEHQRGDGGRLYRARTTT